VKPYGDTPIVSFSQTFTHCCTSLQRCQSQQQQMNVHFQRFNGFSLSTQHYGGNQARN